MLFRYKITSIEGGDEGLLEILDRNIEVSLGLVVCEGGYHILAQKVLVDMVVIPLRTTGQVDLEVFTHYD
jgi:hypothetical protein